MAKPIPPGAAPGAKLFTVTVSLKTQGPALVDQQYALVPRDVVLQMEAALSAFLVELNANPPPPATQPEVKPRFKSVTLSAEARESHKAGMAHPGGPKAFTSLEITWYDLPAEAGQNIKDRLQAGLAPLAAYQVKGP